MADYRPLPVHRGLAACVQRVLVQDVTPVQSMAPGTAPAEHDVVPSPHPVIGFQYRGRLDVLRESGPQRLGPSGITGLLESARTVRAEPGTRSVLVVLRPCGAYRLLGCTMKDLAGEHVPLDALVPGAAARGAEERVANADDGDDAAAAVQSYLLALLGRCVRPPHPAVERAADLLLRTNGRETVDAAAHASGVGRRHLERLFLAQVGVGPKEFASLARFDAAVRALPRSRALAEVALDAGYSDQAHFARDFARRAGRTPGQYRRAASAS